MFWFDKSDNRAVFIDRRVETHWLKDQSVKGGQRKLEIAPDIQADFTALPFPSNYFQVVVFDPPHFEKAGPQSWLRKKYGVLESGWPEMLRAGFSECFRVLDPNGTLIFKWNEYQIPVSQVLKLTTARPLFGHKSGRHSNTHWLTFTKPNTTSTGTATPQGKQAELFTTASGQDASG